MKLKDSIILILSFIIAIALGVFVGVKLTEGKKSDSITNNSSANNNDNLELEKDFSIMEVEKIMSNYLSFKSLYITELSDSTKNGVAIQNIDGIKYSSNSDNCYELFGESYSNDETIHNYCGNNPDMEKYSYQDVLKSKQKLFGRDSDLRKEHFNYRTSLYLYSQKTNSFINTGSYGGGDSCITYQSSITNYEITNNLLHINTQEKVFGCDGNVENVNNYEYIFKKENNNYYLAEINKIA